MTISHDDSLLFTTGEDGVLCIFNIRDNDNRTQNPERPWFSEEVQTTKTELEDKANQLKAAEPEKAELESTFKLKKEMVETTHKTKEAKVRDPAKKKRPKWHPERESKEGERRSINEQQRERKAIVPNVGRPDYCTRR
jgi:hypothetical protein